MISICPEFTNHCNYRCPQCPNSVYRQKSLGGNPYDREKGFMSDELFELVLRNTEKYASVVSMGFFGEQQMHPRFDEYSAELSKVAPLRINTNWSLVTRGTMETLKLYTAVRVSIDASTPELYDTLRPGAPVLDLDGNPTEDRFETIAGKLRYWLKLPDHPKTRLVYVISSHNEYDVMDFIKKWRPFLGPGDHILTKSILTYGGIIRDNRVGEFPCYISSQRYFIVAWNGDCSPCNVDVNLALKGGNLIESEDIGKIVKGDIWKRVMSRIEAREGICANCPDANNWSENEYYYGGSR